MDTSKYKRYLNVLRYWNRICKMDNNRLVKRVLLWDMKQNATNRFTGFRQVCDELGIEIRYNDFSPVDLNVVREKCKEHQSNSCYLSLPKKPKLRTYILFKEKFETEWYVQHSLSRKARSLLAQFRCGVLPLKIETGRLDKGGIPV